MTTEGIKNKIRLRKCGSSLIVRISKSHCGIKVVLIHPLGPVRYATPHFFIRHSVLDSFNPCS